jgi:hypothetical protein
MLGVDELTTNQPPRPGLTKFAQNRIKLGASVHAESLHRMLKDSVVIGENTPPVARRTRRRPRLGNWVPLAEQQAVHHLNKRRIVFLAGHLVQSWHLLMLTERQAEQRHSLTLLLGGTASRAKIATCRQPPPTCSKSSSRYLPSAIAVT